jgi:hypothetical protein
MRQLSAERFTTMTNAEATITENAATVAEQRADVAPEKTSSKKGASQRKGAPKAKKGGKATKPKPPSLRRKPRREKGQTRPRQGSQHAASREQGRKDPGNDRTVQGGDHGRDYESHGWQKHSTGLSLNRRQEPRPQDRVHKDRGWRSRLSDHEVAFQMKPPPARVAAFFTVTRIARSLAVGWTARAFPILRNSSTSNCGIPPSLVHRHEPAHQ